MSDDFTALSGRLDEELADAALLARSLAGERCQPDGHGGSCAWYHGAWPLLRLLGQMATSSVHAGHYDAEVARMAGDPAFGAVLITGSADHGMLKQIASAWKGGPLPAFTVLDRCATPLAVCEWYGLRHGLSVTTLRQDVLQPLPGDRFDAVFTHAFMGNFDEVGRQRLANQWAKVLRPGGRVITVQRVRENFPGDRVGFSPAEAEGFVARIVELLRQPGAAGLAGYGIEEMARDYARNFYSIPVKSADALSAHFERAGFRLDRFERLRSSSSGGVTGPSVPNTDGYFLITAERL